MVTLDGSLFAAIENVGPNEQPGATPKWQLAGYVQMWTALGNSRDEINARLANYVPQLGRWQRETMAKFERMLDEPDAPSTSLH